MAVNYGQIFDCDVGNGPGIRVSLFVSGCTHHCPGCFNACTWDFQYGRPFTQETENQLLQMLSPDYIQGLTLLGGEPMEPQNQEVLLPFLRRLHMSMPDKDVWCYSGYKFEELMGQVPCRCFDPNTTPAMLKHIDVLVDDEFVLARKDVRLKFRGSSNQRILDLKASLAQQSPVWLEEYK